MNEVLNFLMQATIDNILYRLAYLFYYYIDLIFLYLSYHFNSKIQA